MTLYRIRNWNDEFENNRSRTVKDLTWVAVPNRWDGENYTALITSKDGAEIFSAWVLMIQVASRCQPRGNLLRGGGKPHDSASLSLKTRAPKSWFDKAFKFLTENTDWLETTDVAPDCHPPDAIMPDDCQAGDEGRMEWKGKERSELNGIGSYHKDSRTALHWLNEKSGRHFRETAENLGFISERLKEPDISIEGVKAMIDRQCARWKGTDQAEYLRPQTLFNATKFDGYYAARDLPITNGITQPKQHVFQVGE